MKAMIDKPGLYIVSTFMGGTITGMHLMDEEWLWVGGWALLAWFNSWLMVMRIRDNDWGKP